MIFTFKVSHLSEISGP